MRRPATSPIKTEDERIPIGQPPPRSCVDVKSQRTQDSREQHSTVEKPALLSKSSLNWQRSCSQTSSPSTFEADGVFLCFYLIVGLERVKTELREEVSGHSSVSGVESDSDSTTEVNDEQDFILFLLYEGKPHVSSILMKYPQTLSLIIKFCSLSMIVLTIVMLCIDSW